MTEELKKDSQSSQEENKATDTQPEQANASQDQASTQPKRRPQRRPGSRPFQRREKPKEDGKMSVLGIRRVTKVTKGAKRLSFSACVVVGDMNGKIGIGLGKGREVNSAIMQAAARARKLMLNVRIKNGSVPYIIDGKFCKSKVLLRNAPKGTGVKAGNVVRAMCTCLGVQDIVTKVIGNRNFLNVARATMTAFSKIKDIKAIN